MNSNSDSMNSSNNIDQQALPEQQAPSKLRTKRNIIWEETRSLLQDAGYCTWRVFTRKEAIYIIMIIAINQLAFLTKRNPYRVYQIIYRIYRNVTRGAHFRPNRLTKVTLDALGEEERRGVVHEACPRCGCDLGSAPVWEKGDGARGDLGNDTQSTTNSNS